jgi:phosphatidylserine/phosphatidylglycerophosphate/cardiolipin synthase-like enzyme
VLEPQADSLPALEIDVNTTPRDSTIQFLSDGGHRPEDVARVIATFIAGAQQSLDVAIYDAGLTGDLADAVRDAFENAKQRGVAIRLAYHSDTDRSKGVPAPSSMTSTFVDSLGVPCRPAGSQQNLMHHKYVVRDAGTAGAAVLTGSTNWGEDAWSREENVILQLFGDDLAQRYRADFEEVWAGDTDTSGHDAGGTASLSYDGTPMPADVWFAPAEGPIMARAVSKLIAQAARRILVASPVLTSGPVLGALHDIVVAGSVPVHGIVDRTQMEEVLQQWAENGGASWKTAAYQDVARRAGFAGKRSTPWSPRAVHDYMHLKMIVVDDTVVTGSFNFSHSGEDNAENLLRLDSAALAQVCVDAIGALISRYAGTPAVDPA